jgi:hypothetical protein
MKTLSSFQVHAREARHRGESAFSLAELAIVIAILAILVAIAVPVILMSGSKAEHAVAVDNLVTSSKLVDNVWFNKLATQPCPIATGAYRDYSPPEELQSQATDGYVPVGAEYMSTREPKIRWVDLEISGTSEPVASLENGPYCDAGGYGFKIDSVWKNGQKLADGSDIASKWDLMAGAIGVGINKYFRDGGWQDNPDNQYMTLVTLEVHNKIAHFYTLNVGVTIAGGTFAWNNGAGSPGDSFGDELAEKPPSNDNPPGGDNPPGEVNPPSGDNPPGGDNPPATQPVTPPPDNPPATEPVTPPPDNPPATQPVTPPNTPPAGANQASSIRITPQSLNLGSHGVFKARIDMGTEYDAGNINISTVRAYGAAPTDDKTQGNGTLTLTFERDDLDLSGMPIGDSVMFLVTGRYNDGTVFQVWDFIKVME